MSLHGRIRKFGRHPLAACPISARTSLAAPQETLEVAGNGRSKDTALYLLQGRLLLFEPAKHDLAEL